MPSRCPLDWPFSLTVAVLTTQCVLSDLHRRGDAYLGTRLICRKFLRIPCGHAAPVAPSRCLLDLLGTDNPQRFCIAAQDMPLRRQLAQMPDVPSMHINYNCIVLDHPPAAAKVAADQLTRQKLTVSEAEAAWIRSRVAEIRPARAPLRPHRKRAKGPNPLSVKKKRRPVDPRSDRRAGARQPDVMPTGSRTATQRRRQTPAAGASAASPKSAAPSARSVPAAAAGAAPPSSAPSATPLLETATMAAAAAAAPQQPRRQPPRTQTEAQGRRPKPQQPCRDGDVPPYADPTPDSLKRHRRRRPRGHRKPKTPAAVAPPAAAYSPPSR